jgi:large subunit ribosomal protein L20
MIDESGPRRFVMPRAKRGNKRLERRKKILKLAKGYRGTKSKLYRSAKESVERGLNFAYTGRKLKKRDFRSLWIVRIGAPRDSTA